ncbi:MULTISPECIES: DUF2213 domain-containing protein [unclassified Pseudomonas]|jgi:hypothetical protein|uniref:DUF2213 domain-containing protein n=1 Tax=Pseudomonas TaxID=286 RepID=UPI000C882FA6|nr:MULTISPECIES: DUF2213 domain-containing protein [unclassified Pseudomonas]MBL1311269.1 DUF2213 domain-containing protein [Pseudomonas sp.]PMX19106.1 hypothetical protein C1Y25_00435 [Pseudomonas sp. MPBC4-3]PMX50067.1 hypothetical protein C1Y20_04150 [Pseudomonas sp. FW301-21B01]PMY10783.1 hypothetical protein C1Y18_01980 [Pseudomonas sp. MPR-R5A]PNA72950.1 hypothetical protein C1Y14_01535 [Pseudomonas sp. MPR-R5B]
MKCTVFDRAGYRITQREYTDEGFLKVPGRVARTGIQEYLARELGLDGDPMRVVRVYRPEDEVFSDASLGTYDASDVTNNHPHSLVTAATYKGVAVGVVRGPGRRDGDFVICDLIVKDQKTIDEIIGGKCELSAGYTAVYDETPGVTEDGQTYDYIQRDIKINHVAIVERARAGANARVFDHTPESNMTHKVTLDSGSSVEVSDAATAVAITDAFERLNKKANDAQVLADKAQATADKAAEDLAEARKASSDEAINARVVLIGSTQALARKIAGDSFTCDSLDVIEIKRAALAVKRPKMAWGDKSAGYVECAFDAEAEKEPDEDDMDEEGKKKPKAATGDTAALFAQFMQLAKDGAATTATADAAPTPYQQHKQKLSGAHKQPQKGA